MCTPLRNTLCSILFLWATILHAEGRSVPGVGPDDGRYVGKHIEILEDPLGSMRLPEVLSAEGFRSTGKDVPNLGTTKSAFWLRFDALNDGPEAKLMLIVAHPEIDELDLYMVGKDGYFHLASTGQSRGIGKRSDEHREFAFELPLKSGQGGTIYLRVKSNKQLQVPVKLTTASNYYRNKAVRDLLIGAYIGIMLVMALYNLFIFASIRDRSYLIYVIYILAVTLTQLTFVGVGQFYLWTEWPWLSEKASIILTLITALAASEFMRSFIETKKHAPSLDRGLRMSYVVLVGVGLIYVLVDPIKGYQLTQVISGLFATFMLVAMMHIRAKGSRQAGFFILAWAVFLTGVVIYVLKDIGILPYNTITVYIMPLGSAIEGVLLSFGLADRINILRREKDQSQAESLRISKENERIIREQNVILEERVKERTHALEESHEHLKHTQTQLVNAEKMASLGQLTAGIAHEINNPINFITSNINPLRRNISEIVEVMQEYRSLEPGADAAKLQELRKKDEQMGIQESIEELDDIINSIAEGSSRTAEIVRGLRNFSRLDESDLKESDLNEGIRNTLTVLYPQYRDKVRIDTVLGDIPKVECFPGKVNQVFMNILTNAAQATLARSGDHERIVTIGSALHEDHVIISITDNGIGMSDEVKARIFDPFFTTKAVGEGTGLGMAIVYGIIEDHRGSIRIDSTPGKGTEFRIALPIRHVQLNERRA